MVLIKITLRMVLIKIMLRMVLIRDAFPAPWKLTNPQGVMVYAVMIYARTDHYSIINKAIEKISAVLHASLMQLSTLYRTLQ